jgi:hypothetical protein
MSSLIRRAELIGILNTFATSKGWEHTVCYMMEKLDVKWKLQYVRRYQARGSDASALVTIVIGSSFLIKLITQQTLEFRSLLGNMHRILLMFTERERERERGGGRSFVRIKTSRASLVCQSLGII